MTVVALFDHFFSMPPILDAAHSRYPDHVEVGGRRYLLDKSVEDSSMDSLRECLSSSGEEFFDRLSKLPPRLYGGAAHIRRELLGYLDRTCGRSPKDPLDIAIGDAIRSKYLARVSDVPPK